MENLTEIEVGSPEEVVQLLAKGQSRRATASTSMNEVSSRSHLVLSLTTTRYEGARILRGRLNLVDLAGSERVKDSAVSGDRLGEACRINKSLHALAGVVEALESGKAMRGEHIPYRDSKLTWLLSNSLGGNCKTALIATASPSLASASETLSTMRFAHACKNIKNEVSRNEYRSAARPAFVRPSKKQKVPLPWKGTRVRTEQHFVDLASGERVSVVLSDGALAASGAWVVCLHGCPSSAEEFFHFLPGLVFAGFRVLIVEQPGYGESSGTRFASRSERNLDKGGPVDVTIAVMKHFGVEKAHFLGYDWGAGIVLSLALGHPKRMMKGVSFHPSYTESTKDELKKITRKILVLWVKEDMFHSWKSWKTLAMKIPNSQHEVLSLKPWKQHMAYSAYASISG